MAGSRWAADGGAPRGDDYDARWRQLAAAGESIHGEADFVGRYEPASVLDAGCGTGRVAIELAARGIDVVGVDLDAAMLSTARQKAPDIEWHQRDLADVELGRTFQVVVLAGNVMIFVEPGTEADVVATMARHTAPGGRLIAGFQLGRGYTAERYAADAAAAGLDADTRYSTWDGDAFDEHGGYVVAVHRRPTNPEPLA